MMLRALIADDEPLARRRLARLLAEHPDVQVVAEAGTGDEAVALALQHRPDLVFLDVSMPGRSGLEALASLRAMLPEELVPRAVFTTAHEEHAVVAFELEGTDYLLKPVEKPGLERALRRVRKSMAARRGEAPPPAAAAPAAAVADEPDAGGPRLAPVKHLAAQHAGKILNLAVDDVAAVSVEDELTFAHTPQGRYLVNMPLHEVERRLPSPPFVQVSRSAILSIAWIEHLEPAASGTFVATLRAPMKLRVEISRRRARVLRELLGF